MVYVVLSPGQSISTIYGQVGANTLEHASDPGKLGLRIQIHHVNRERHTVGFDHALLRLYSSLNLGNLTVSDNRHNRATELNDRRVLIRILSSLHCLPCGAHGAHGAILKAVIRGPPPAAYMHRATRGIMTHYLTVPTTICP